MADEIPTFEFRKRPEGNWPIAIDCTGRLPPGVLIASGTISSTDQDGSDATSEVIQGPSGTISANQLQFILRVRQGSAGSVYDILVFINGDDGSTVIVEKLRMKVVL